LKKSCQKDSVKFNPIVKSVIKQLKLNWVTAVSIIHMDLKNVHLYNS
jgi:hypothetical protein